MTIYESHFIIAVAVAIAVALIIEAAMCDLCKDDISNANNLEMTTSASNVITMIEPLRTVAAAFAIAFAIAEFYEATSRTFPSPLLLLLLFSPSSERSKIPSPLPLQSTMTTLLLPSP